MKITDWFDAEIKPVHRGVYQLQDLFREHKYFYAHWDGYCWRIENEHGSPLRFQYRRWRGVEQE